MLSFCNPKDCSLPGSSVHRISQAKISSPKKMKEYRKNGKDNLKFWLPGNPSAIPLHCPVWKVSLFSTMCCSVLSHIRLFGTPWIVGCQASLFLRIFQARIQEWVAMPSSRGSSQPRDGNQVSRISGGFFIV